MTRKPEKPTFIDFLLDGPSLEGLDLERGKSPMRDVDLGGDDDQDDAPRAVQAGHADEPPAAQPARSFAQHLLNMPKGDDLDLTREPSNPRDIDFDS